MIALRRADHKDHNKIYYLLHKINYTQMIGYNEIYDIHLKIIFYVIFHIDFLTLL